MIEEKDILAYLDGIASEELVAKVESWIGESQANRDEFEFTKLIWEESSAASTYKQFDTEQEWQIFEEAMLSSTVRKKGNEAKVVPLKSSNRWRTILSVAASFVGLIFATWLLWPQSEFIEIVDASENLELLLDDGSKVEISQGASFKTKRIYKYEKTRDVEIAGEVRFDIAPNPDKPFIVATEESAVEVLGTVFNVKTEGVTSEVANEEGLIKFFIIENPTESVELQPGDVFMYDGTGFVDLNEPEPEPEPEPIPTVQDIIQYLRTISNGRVTFGSGINENRLTELDIDYEGKSVTEVIREMKTKAIVVEINKGCPTCLEIIEIIPRKR